MKTVRRPPYPKWNPGYFPCSSLTPLPLSSRRPSVSFGGFGLSSNGLPGVARTVYALKQTVFSGPQGLSSGAHSHRADFSTTPNQEGTSLDVLVVLYAAKSNTDGTPQTKPAFSNELDRYEWSFLDSSAHIGAFAVVAPASPFVIATNPVTATGGLGTIGATQAASGPMEGFL